MIVTFITSNKDKAEHLANNLGLRIEHRNLDITEIQSLSLEEIVKDKAQKAYEIIKSPVLVEDASLKYTAFGNLPGPLIKWFHKELGNSGLCRIINHYKKDRTALSEVLFCLYDGKEFKLFAGSKAGRIAAYPRGEMGYGWDAVFIPDGSNKTRAEMDDDERFESSMRKEALEKVREYLAK